MLINCVQYTNETKITNELEVKGKEEEEVK